MNQKEILKALRHLKVETGSLACLGRGRENSCSTKGCAVIRAAIETLEETHTTGDCISRQAALEAIDAECKDAREAAREMSCLGAEHDKYIATLSLDHVRKRVEQLPAVGV